MSRVLGLMGERGIARAAAAAAALIAGAVEERFEAPHFRYEFECLRPRDPRAVIELRREIDVEQRGALDPRWRPERLNALMRELAAQPDDVAWRGEFRNLVVTVGKDDILGNEFTGSSYTAAWYMGLVDGAAAPAFAATDTMAAHPGWTENVGFSQAARPTLAFAAASAGSIALASAAVFSINAAGTIAGAFFCTNATLNGTTGTLYSAGAFTGGNKTVGNGDTLNVSATQAV